MILVKFVFKNSFIFMKPRFVNIFLCKVRLSSSWPDELTIEVKKNIENKWRENVNQLYPSPQDAEKFYLLSMFPYPSGRLHMGHMRVYTISDAIARFLQMNGKKVIHPIGWDAFGLPAENAAIEKNIHPAEWTKSNIETMKQQLKDLNICFDWNRELATCEPSYYRWTQHLFLLMYDHGLVYRKKALVNWDPVDQTVLADEQVDENGCSWRSGCKVEKRRLSQWFLRTSTFSKSLYEGLNNSSLVEWRDATKIQQHWIGVPNGHTIHLRLCLDGQLLPTDETLAIWTDQVEFLHGATFVAISPDNQFSDPEYRSELSAVHPLTGEKLPVFITADLDHSKSTDSYLGIPGGNCKKDIDFAKRHSVRIVDVFDSATNTLLNSHEFSGMDKELAREHIVMKLKSKGINVYESSQKLRDWLISRQRYWGTPIPMVHCTKCKCVPVPATELPVLLPEFNDVVGRRTSLSSAKDWLKCLCPRCGSEAQRETDTMDTFVDSSWYFLRFLDVKNSVEMFDRKKIDELMPVDLYIGGKEHAALHLFYARFVCHFLNSLQLLSQREPFTQLLMQGMVLGKSYRLEKNNRYLAPEEVDFSGPVLSEKSSGEKVIEDWEKMSKSKHNGVDPQEVLCEYGIDTTRLFILGNVAPESPRKWNDELFAGIQNFQRRLWLTVSDFIKERRSSSGPDLEPEQLAEIKTRLTSTSNYYLKGVTHNLINTRQLSVAISKLQGLLAELRRLPKNAIRTDSYERTLALLLIMLAPIAPHFTSELWDGFKTGARGADDCFYNLSLDVLHQKWPTLDPNSHMLINIKVNDEAVDSIPMSHSTLLKLSDEETIRLALGTPTVQNTLAGVKVKSTKLRRWSNYDSEVNIFCALNIKKAKKKKKAAIVNKV